MSSPAARHVLLVLAFGAGLSGMLALGGCAPAYDPDALFDALQNSDLEARQEAGETLEKLVRAGDYKVFIRGLESPNPQHQAQAIVFLARLTRPEGRSALRGLLRIGKRMMLPFNPIRLRPASEVSDSRVLVAHLIAVTGRDPEAIDLLLEGVDQNQPPAVVAATCFAIGALSDPKGIPFLEAATHNTDVEVARAAVQALGRFAEPEAVQALKGMTSHPALEVRSDVLTSIQEREAPGFVEILQAIGASDPSPDLRAAAIRGLMMKRGRLALAPYFIERLQTGDALSRTAAREALEKISGHDLGPRPESWSKWWKENQARFTTVR
jgi:HEAT repeat protein